MKHTILYTSDLHGNTVQYEKLVRLAFDMSADSVIIGGDISPKGFACKSAEEFITVQREFFANGLPKLLKPLQDKSQVFIMMGNDDCASNNDVFEKKDTLFYKIIHDKRLKLTPEFDIVGYSNVPITPFGIKDWEKFDLTTIPPAHASEYAARKAANYKMTGLKSSELRWTKFEFSPEMEQADSIQKDLSQKLFTENPDKTIYVMHSPPDNTKLDQIMTKAHVGSFAIRFFIEENQPYLTLHGHIHETVNISGDFRHQIGKTLCMSSGNHNVGEHLAVVVFDAYKPKEAKRIVV
ncbi:MAG: metallophosphoesterase [Candidatus Aenigmarchaeota archaeon]|nr:metallophosphoesterase [Candidatus Aenigmarchaeota archaeon]